MLSTAVYASVIVALDFGAGFHPADVKGSVAEILYNNIAVCIPKALPH
jgi:hypothetical protein